MVRKLIYTAFSKRNFYFKSFISKFVIEKGELPLNPFMLFDYFLLDSVDRDSIRDCNNQIVLRVDEVWVFGEISNGVAAEIQLAKKTGKPLRYFEIIESKEIKEIKENNTRIEFD